ncbi:MAG: hypothetical protein R3E77_15565 [Steroidobacteraceae bacterium]
MTEKPLRSGVPRSSPDPAFFDNPTIDRLIEVTLELGAELWVQRERLGLIERLLAQHGVVTREMLENQQLDDQTLQATARDRDEFVARIFGSFARDKVSAGLPADGEPGPEGR